MLSYDKQSADTQAGLLKTKGDLFAEAFIHLLETLHHTEPLEYILTLISDILNGPGVFLFIFTGKPF